MHYLIYGIFLAIYYVNAQESYVPEMFGYVGDPYILVCNIAMEKFDNSTSYWTFNDTNIPFNSTKYGLEFEERPFFSKILQMFGFLLEIKNLTKSDSGTYTCFHANKTITSTKLTVNDKSIFNTSDFSYDVPTSKPVTDDDFAITHTININVTDCCGNQSVPVECHDPCLGKMGIPDHCLDHKDKIDACIINGKDHRDCCKRRLITGHCLDLCTHSSSDQAMLKSCKEYLSDIYQCIEQGHYILPSPPLYVKAKPLNSTAIEVTWSPPNSNPHLVRSYRIIYYRLVLPATYTHNLNNDNSDTKLLTNKTVRTQDTHESIFGTGNSPRTQTIKTTGHHDGLSYETFDPNNALNNEKIGSAITTSLAPVKVHVFHDPDSIILDGADSTRVPSEKMFMLIRNESSVSVPSNKLVHILDNLIPSSSYEIYVQSVGDHGSSLLSDVVEIYTKSDEVPVKPTSNIQESLNSIQDCCKTNHVSDKCLPLLCQPHTFRSNASRIILECTDYFNTAMNCIVGIDKHNHTDCCIQNRIPKVCYGFCDGSSPTVKTLQQVSCINHIDAILSCVTDDYTMLPGSPVNVKTLYKGSTLVTLDWDAPVNNTHLIISYTIYYRQIDNFDNNNDNGDNSGTLEKTIEKDDINIDLGDVDQYETILFNVSHGPPFTLTNLSPDTWYELFVVSNAINGSSLPSNGLRILTRPRISDHVHSVITSYPTTMIPNVNSTKPESIDDQDFTGDENEKLEDINLRPQNCCIKHNLDSKCLPLCRYDMDFSPDSQLINLTVQCFIHFADILTCLADGRYNTPCCRDRGVSATCSLLCSSRLPFDAKQGLQNPAVAQFLPCINSTVQILECFEKGIQKLPSQPTNLILAGKNETALLYEWQAPSVPNLSKDSNGVPDKIYYTVVYIKDEFPFPAPSQIKVDEPRVYITNLQSNTSYRMFVTANNKHGSSLPSYTMIGKTDESSTSLITIPSVLKPTTYTVISPPKPYEIEISDVGVDYISLKWRIKTATSQSDNRDSLPLGPPFHYNVYFAKVSDTLDPYLDESYHSINVSKSHYTITNLDSNTRYKIFVTSADRLRESLPSEKIIVRTADKSNPTALIEVIQGDEMVLTNQPHYVPGTSIQLRCLTTGTPKPSITWYNRMDDFKEPIWHGENYTIDHLDKSNIGQYKCMARNKILPNGKAFYYLRVGFGPKVSSESRRNFASSGDNVTLSCTVEALPFTQTNVTWFKDDREITLERIPGSISYCNRSYTHAPVKYTYFTQLHIYKVNYADSGTYKCVVNNMYGMDSFSSDLIIENNDESFNLSECCDRLNVKTDCMPVCNYNVNVSQFLFGLSTSDTTSLSYPDHLNPTASQSKNQNLTSITNKLHCLSELPKIVHCAADGRNHEQCCKRSGVPWRCVRFCEGNIPHLSMPNLDDCLGYAQTIITCYRKGIANIPTMPVNVRGEVIHGNMIILKWDAPIYNSDKIRYYIIYYKPANQIRWILNRTLATSLRFSDLKPNTEYFFQVVASGADGSSHKTSMLRLLTTKPTLNSLESLSNSDQLTHEIDAEKSKSKPSTIALTFIGLILLVSCSGLVAYIFVKKKIINFKRPISFDNPGYDKEHVLQDITPSSALYAGSNITNGHNTSFDRIGSVRSDDTITSNYYNNTSIITTTNNNSNTYNSLHNVKSSVNLSIPDKTYTNNHNLYDMSSPLTPNKNGLNTNNNSNTLGKKQPTSASMKRQKNELSTATTQESFNGISGWHLPSLHAVPTSLNITNNNAKESPTAKIRGNDELKTLSLLEDPFTAENNPSTNQSDIIIMPPPKSTTRNRQKEGLITFDDEESPNIGNPIM